MAMSILQHLKDDGPDIKLCRAQCYSNGASMSDMHSGVQQKNCEINPKVLLYKSFTKSLRSTFIFLRPLMCNVF